MTTTKQKGSERDRVRKAFAEHCKKHGKPAPRKWTKPMLRKEQP